LVGRRRLGDDAISKKKYAEHRKEGGKNTGPAWSRDPPS